MVDGCSVWNFQKISLGENLVSQIDQLVVRMVGLKPSSP